MSYYINILQTADAGNVFMHGVRSRSTAIHAIVPYSGVIGEITSNRRSIK
jgi:hypothetical protein